MMKFAFLYRDLLPLQDKLKKIVMRVFKCLAVLFLVFTICSAFSLKKKASKPVYVMGVSISFIDSLVYFTDVQSIPDVKLTKEGFLPQRDDYSYQLRNYLESKDGNRNHTCITYFSEDKAKLQKKAALLTKRYMNDHSAVVQNLSKNEFQYVKPEAIAE